MNPKKMTVGEVIESLEEYEDERVVIVTASGAFTDYIDVGEAEYADGEPVVKIGEH